MTSSSDRQPQKQVSLAFLSFILLSTSALDHKLPYKLSNMKKAYGKCYKVTYCICDSEIWRSSEDGCNLKN